MTSKILTSENAPNVEQNCRSHARWNLQVALLQVYVGCKPINIENINILRA